MPIYTAAGVNLETSYHWMMKPFLFWNLLVLQSPFPCATLTPTLDSQRTDVCIPRMFHVPFLRTCLHTYCLLCLPLSSLFLCHPLSLSQAVLQGVVHPFYFMAPTFIPLTVFMIWCTAWLFFCFFTSTLQCLSCSVLYL